MEITILQKKVFGNDGGVYYSKTTGTAEEISSRNSNFVTTQFYTLGVAPSEMFKDLDKQISGNDLSDWREKTKRVRGMTDVFISGAQDNGTQFQSDNEDRITTSIDISGGDGAASMFSQNISKPYFITNYVYNNYVEAYDFITNDFYRINSESGSNGDFINVQALTQTMELFTQTTLDLTMRLSHTMDGIILQQRIKGQTLQVEYFPIHNLLRIFLH